MKKISVIIPFFNTNKEYLKTCLNSCFSQNCSNFEILLINDGSTIDYNDIISQYPSIKYIETNNFGVSHARNLGMNASTGDYILFLDSDDYLTPTCLSDFVKQLDNNNYDIILSRVFINNKTIELNKCNINNSFLIKNKELLYKSMIYNNYKKFSCVDTVWAKLYKKDFILLNNISFDEQLKSYEDVIFNFEAYAQAKQIYFFNKPTYYYVVNHSSICHSFQEDMQKNSLLYLNKSNMLKDKLNICENDFPDMVLRVVVRLFRKYYNFIEDEILFEQDLKALLDNQLILENIKRLDKTQLDHYKQELVHLIINKDNENIKEYVKSVCKKNLLLK